ncbi:MAG: GNAT family N-acetyltransferase [Candidatus Woesearchaeota archaeon]
MDKIIKLNKGHTKILSEIDYESEHQYEKKQNISKQTMKKGIIKRFQKKQEIFFGYKINNILVGYITLKPFFPGHNHCEIYWLAIRKKYQKKGIGKKLVKFIETYAKKKGFRKVCLYTNKNMKKTRAFYEKIGYKYINEFKGYYGYKNGNTTSVLYTKKI